MTDRAEVPIQEVNSNNPFKVNSTDPLALTPVWVPVKEPRIFAINDSAYLAQAGLMPPTFPVLPGTTDPYDLTTNGYLQDKWEEDSLPVDYRAHEIPGDAPKDGYYEVWLFDRVSTHYRQAMRRGDVRHYREAYNSHEFYIAQIEVAGANTNIPDCCIGGWDYLSVANSFTDSGGQGCDSKYLYAQAFKLHLGVTGDDSWQPSENGTPRTGIIETRQQAWIAMGNLVFSGSQRGGSALNQPIVDRAGFSQVYDELRDGFTERKSGLGLQTLMSACELSLDGTVCGWVDTVIDNLHLMQTDNPDSLGNVGYLSHSWHVHEGEWFPYLGTVAQAVTSSTTLTIKESMLDKLGKLVTGDGVVIQNQLRTLAAAPTKNPDNTWTLTLTTAVTASVNNWVGARFKVSPPAPANTMNLDFLADRAFSPWMLSMVADGVWEYYWWTDDAARKQKARDLLLGFAHAVARYGVDGLRTTTTAENAIKAAWPDVNIFDSTGLMFQTGCSLTRVPTIRYSGSTLMSRADVTSGYMDYMLELSNGSDGHSAEGLFQMALGIFFETDPVKKQALKILAADVAEWFERTSCTSGNKAKYGGGVSTRIAFCSCRLNSSFSSAASGRARSLHKGSSTASSAACCTSVT